MLEPPKNYNEMLPMLHKATFITTFIFYLSLVIYGYIPLVGINASTFHQSKTTKNLLSGY